MSADETLAVLGAGSWGTALALLLARGGSTVRLWDRTPAQVAALRSERENRRYLPGHPLSPRIHPTDTLEEAIDGVAGVVLAVPAGAVEAVARRLMGALPAGADLLLAAKGIAPDTLELPSQTLARALGAQARSHAVIALSGPNLAREVAAGIPTAAIAASADDAAALRVAERFNRPSFRVYVGSDLLGVEIGGAVKNVLAIAGGVSDGLGYGDNTKAALLTRGLAEMARLGVALGARRETFYGLAGVGDLMATAASRLSRNWRVGEGLALGKSLETVLSELGQVAEGVPTARAVAALATRHALSLPVCAAVEALLAGRLAPREAVALLTENRSAGWE